LAVERGEGSAPRPGRFLPPGKTRYPLYRRMSGPQGRSGQVRKTAKKRDTKNTKTLFSGAVNDSRIFAFRGESWNPTTPKSEGQIYSGAARCPLNCVLASWCNTSRKHKKVQMSTQMPLRHIRGVRLWLLPFLPQHYLEVSGQPHAPAAYLMAKYVPIPTKKAGGPPEPVRALWRNLSFICTGLKPGPPARLVA
jgi:hypothetical protein